MSALFDCPVCGQKKSIPKTNADRIRAMLANDEEMALLLYRFCSNSISCIACPMKDNCAEGENLHSWNLWCDQPAEVE